MIIVGSVLVYDYPMQIESYFSGPFKWWTLVSFGSILFNVLPVASWIVYLFLGTEDWYFYFYRTAGIASLGPFFLHWVALFLIYFGYDSMNFIRDMDKNFTYDYPLLFLAAAPNLFINLTSVFQIVEKYHLIYFTSKGYCVYGNLVTNCPEPLTS